MDAPKRHPVKIQLEWIRDSRRGKAQPVKAGRSPALVKTALQPFLRVLQTGRTGATLMAGRKRRKSREDKKRKQCWKKS